ncbi:ThiJ/PfpI domain protein [Magnetococcus marinus MC-1]|uniref:ThiJ/PfpI domain protein n=1 Tax=Magnetococcus marinus (strain ATCC BAA-1437 / JCM 17883 / MC-1) TaxID=156889 RepID=A0LDC9_MAGMM|nr:isoprenoid biosynthesis glyoxalase ElbB [Magnetococcus marinus]ABK45972.1 ThiJ/PfpI domain protein [Magnetococcus marinus MC-1]
MGKRIGVVLSGCGVYDGAEIHEATLTLYFLDKAGTKVVCMAPDKDQFHVVNHLTGDEMPERRNVRVESARIARGDVKRLDEVKATELDGLIIPGGFGMAKNLSTLAFDGANAQVDEDLVALVMAMHGAGKPIGALCITPAVLSKILAERGVRLTIGNDEGTAEAIRNMGNTHVESGAEQIIIDEQNNVISSAAYMCAASIAEAGVGIEKLVAEVLKRA